MGTVSWGEDRKDRTNGVRRRIWVQHVAVETDKIEMRVQAARARGR
jgi:4-hydroxyphenylpyruvate dioxygenase-like putative hemolysin